MTSTGYFTSRNEIISWINDLLITCVTKIEQLGSGAIYCHILDAAYPQKVPLTKVKWAAYLQVDFLHNYKILQTCFQRLGIAKHIDIQKLCKAKYQDNLEFIQWMKWYLGPKIKQNSYNALVRRNNAEINLNFCDKKGFDLKQSLIKDNRQIKAFPSQMISSVLSPRASKVLKLQTQNQIALSKAQSIKQIKISRKIPKISSSNLVVSIDLKDKKKKKIEVTYRKNKPLKEKTNFGNVEIIESDQQECF